MGTVGRPADALLPLVRDHWRRAGRNRPSGSHEPGENVIRIRLRCSQTARRLRPSGWALAVSQPWHRLAESGEYGRTRKDTTKLRINYMTTLEDPPGSPTGYRRFCVPVRMQ